jgi:hypothetical protein
VLEVGLLVLLVAPRLVLEGGLPTLFVVVVKVGDGIGDDCAVGVVVCRLTAAIFWYRYVIDSLIRQLEKGNGEVNSVKNRKKSQFNDRGKGLVNDKYMLAASTALGSRTKAGYQIELVCLGCVIPARYPACVSQVDLLHRESQSSLRPFASNIDLTGIWYWGSQPDCTSE